MTFFGNREKKNKKTPEAVPGETVRDSVDKENKKEIKKEANRAKRDQQMLFLSSIFLMTLSGLIILAVACSVSVSDSSSGAATAVIGVLAFMLSAALCVVFYLNKAAKTDFENDSELPKLVSDVLKKLDYPVIITELSGRIGWSNENFRALNTEGEKSLENLLGVTLAELEQADEEGGKTLSFGDRKFTVRVYPLRMEKHEFRCLVFTDKTDLWDALEAIETESPVIAYAVLDNTDRLSQFVKASFRNEANSIEKVLGQWAESLDGYIREYDRDKYMIVFPRCRLAECIKNGFSVLEDVKNAGTGENGMTVTVSMGISSSGSTLREREADAAAALETALQRGGDQAVLRGPDGHYAYYGGKTKSEVSRTRIITRTAADKLISLIRNAGNVIIMGHSGPDFDSIGGCIGLSILARTYNENVRIVADETNPNFRISTEALFKEKPGYSGIIINGDAAMELLRSDTLLIVADVNNMKIVECPDLAANAAQLAIVDHHRKITEFDNEPVLTVIEPGSSSCCELVSEMLETAAMTAGGEYAAYLRPSACEADIMLSGIMLDTKNFTRTTGEETFAAAMFLKAAGADPERVRNFFISDESAFREEAMLGANIRHVTEKIVLSAEKAPVYEGHITPADRIAASRTAETMLELRNIDAAFILVYTDSEVLISARSNGKINVQLILEQLGGGGRYDAAGAQLSGKVASAVVEQLEDLINAYVDSIKQKE